jgi:hypothetical protein
MEHPNKTSPTNSLQMAFGTTKNTYPINNSYTQRAIKKKTHYKKCLSCKNYAMCKTIQQFINRLQIKVNKGYLGYLEMLWFSTCFSE